jgi:uncharacterized protein (TIGR04255 family)
VAVRHWFAYGSGMPLDPDREIYPNAPLKLVAFELRYPPVRAFDSDQGQQAVYERLRDQLPILGAPPVTTFEVGPSGPRQTGQGMRVLDRRRTETVTVTDQALTVETSAYTRYEEFAALLKQALIAANDVGQIPAALRVGLRYIDEIHVPGVQTVEDWRDYITDDLLAPAFFEGYSTLDYRGLLGLQVAGDSVVTVRFGVVEAPVVDPNGPLRIRDSPEGRYFLLDVDCAWTAPQDEYLEFDVNGALQRSETLHEPIRTIFERAIKPKLRDEVLRRKENANG